jgi:hypothetical protein
MTRRVDTTDDNRPQAMVPNSIFAESTPGITPIVHAHKKLDIVEILIFVATLPGTNAGDKNVTVQMKKIRRGVSEDVGSPITFNSEDNLNKVVDILPDTFRLNKGETLIAEMSCSPGDGYDSNCFYITTDYRVMGE